MNKLQVDVRGVSSSVLDSLQSLRTSIMYMNDTHVVSFTSTLPSEGKSILSFYTAVSFSSLDKKTLFIDCDMRRSHIKRYFGLVGNSQEKLAGISEFITNQKDELLYHTNYPKLDIIPCGKCPPDPGAILSSEKFNILLDQLRKEYEYIIIDTPPVSVASDASIVGRHSDGVIYVVRDNHVKSSEAKHCIDILERNECRILGVVSNMVSKSNEHSYYYGAYRYYDEDHN